MKDAASAEWQSFVSRYRDLVPREQISAWKALTLDQQRYLEGTFSMKPPDERMGKSMQRGKIAIGIGLTLGGGFVALVGLLVFLNRLQLAATLLGAKVMFGMPFDQGDSQKVVVMALAGIGITGFGGIVLLIGIVMALVAFARSR